MENVLRDFPEWHTEIRHLVDIDPVFREICEDYEMVAGELTAWLRAQNVEQTQIDEWRALLSELVAEIRETLEQRFPPDSD